MFGSSSAFGGGSTFGSSSLFGSKPTSTFGSGSSLFGSSSTGTGSGLFGSTTNTGSSLFGSSTTSGFGSASSGLGTKHAAWSETNQQEKNKKTGMKTLQLQSISGMEQYKTKSHEELRLEDLFNTAFSKPGTAPTTSFGSGGMFGSSTTTGGGLFGNSTSTGSSIFGSSGTSSGGLFGSSTNTSTGFGGFGSSTSSGGLFGSKPATTGGLFGSSSTNTGGGLFGSSNTSGGGLFGSSSSTNSSGGLFGSNTNSGGGLFGSSNTNKTTSLFGNNTSSGGLFGSSNNTSSGGLFGSNNNSSGGLFGNSSTNTGSSLFGNSSSSGGLFGNTNKSTSLFGNNTSSGGLFGNSNTSGGLFGNNNSNTSSIFGNSTTNNNNNVNTGLIAQANANPYAINLELAKEQVSNYTACPTKKVTIVRKVQPVERPRFGFVPKRYQPKPNFLKSSLMSEADAYKKPPELASSVLYTNRNTMFTRDNPISYDWRRQYHKLSSRRTLQPLPLPEPPKLKTCNLDDQNPPHFEPFDEEEKQFELKSTGGCEDKIEEIAGPVLERVKVAHGEGIAGDMSPVKITSREAVEPLIAGEDANPTGFKGDPTPKLFNPEMRTSPRFEDLCAMTEKQLSSVSDFEIEHVQYGQIKWDNPVDLRGVNLDEIVCFSQSSFELYPNMDPKPEFGTGFMTPCMVMLYNVWPKGYNSVDRPSLLREQRYRTSLEKHCRSCGYDDVSYEDGVVEFTTNRDILM